jgi:membrane protein required for colicin V production
MAIDIACLVVLAFAFFRGYKRGLIMAVFTVAAYVIGAFATMHFSFLVSDYLAANFNISGTWLPIVAFAITFFLVVLLVRWLGKLMEKAMTRVLPTAFNRFIGSLVYMSLALVLLSLLYNVASAGDVFKDDLVARSVFAPHLDNFAGLIHDHIGDVIPFVEQLFDRIDAYFEEAAGKIEA